MKNPPCNAGGESSIPGQGTKISRASPCPPSGIPQLEKTPCLPQLEKAWMLQPRPSEAKIKKKKKKFQHSGTSHVPCPGGLGKGLSGHWALKAKQGKEAGVRGHRKSSPWGRGQRAPWEGRGHWGLSCPGSSQPAPSPDTPLHSTHGG